MARSPQQGSDGVVRVSVKVNGARIGEHIGLVSVQVRRAVGKVPSARLVISDGDMPRQRWPVADGATFKPGSRIQLSAGYGPHESIVFEGLIVGMAVRIAGTNLSHLVVDCRDAAVRLTTGRRNAIYTDQSDSEVLRKLAGDHGLKMHADDTGPPHRELVQYYCSDWDFLVARAEVNGLLVIADDGRLSALAPAVDDAPVLAVAWGQDLMEFNAEIDARTQFSRVSTAGWDPAQQALAEGDDAEPEALNAQGNLDGEQLAAALGAAQSLRLQTAAPLAAEDLSRWGRAQQLKAGLARVRGRMRFQGSALARPGRLISVKGVGARFDGDVFVGAVEHQISDGDWTTTVDFGLDPGWFCERPDVAAPQAAGRLPGATGLQIGIVMQVEGDPAGEQRVQLQLPVLAAERPALWARLLQFHASDGFGAFFVPEVGDEVLVGFLDGDPSCPVILGSLYSSRRQPPYPLAPENNTKAVVTRCKSRLEFDEKDSVITLTTPALNRLVLSDKDKSVLLQDQNGNRILLDPAGITLESPKDITLKAQGKVVVDAVGAVTVTSKADVSARGLNIACEAQAGFTAKGDATAELSASGQTTVRGAMVLIN
jgi:Rhs element Vgr protein